MKSKNGILLYHATDKNPKTEPKPLGRAIF